MYDMEMAVNQKIKQAKVKIKIKTRIVIKIIVAVIVIIIKVDFFLHQTKMKKQKNLKHIFIEQNNQKNEIRDKEVCLLSFSFFFWFRAIFAEFAGNFCVILAQFDILVVFCFLYYR